MDKNYADYLLNRVREDYNLIAEDFSRTREKPWLELGPLMDYALPGDNVLDLGCGNGRLIEFLKNRKISYIGVDTSEKLVEIAKKKYPEYEFKTSESLKLLFSENQFDKIYSIAVLHHIPSNEFRKQFLLEAKRVLKSGGLLIVTVWKFCWLKEIYLRIKFGILKIFGFSKLDFGDIWEPWSDKTNRYYHCFTKIELNWLAKSAGFKMRQIGTIRSQTGSRQNFYFVAEK